MKKLSMAFSIFAALACFSFTGCPSTSTETAVVEAPAEDDGSAMDGKSDDEYNKAMEESMNEQG